MGTKIMRLFPWLMTILVLIIVAVPFIPLVLWGFSAGWTWPEVLPHSFSTRAWRYAFSGSAGTWEAVWNSLRIALVVSLINLVLAVPAADALARPKFKGKWATTLKMKVRYFQGRVKLVSFRQGFYHLTVEVGAQVFHVIQQAEMDFYPAKD